LNDKIFGIGFQKTGTSSLNRALRMLGYRAAGGLRINHPKGVSIAPPLSNAKVWPAALAYAQTADAFSDAPWPLLFRQLDAAFPAAKFVLTVRNDERWIGSMVRHFGDRPSDVMQWTYEVPCVAGHEDECLRVYRAHNEAVRAHFAERPHDLLEIDFERGAGWRELCVFLGKPVPAAEFPHDNRAEERERKKGGLWRRMKTRVRSVFVPT
jgi:hypothetical protein